MTQKGIDIPNEFLLIKQIESVLHKSIHLKNHTEIVLQRSFTKTSRTNQFRQTNLKEGKRNGNLSQYNPIKNSIKKANDITLTCEYKCNSSAYLT